MLNEKSSKLLKVILRETSTSVLNQSNGHSSQNLEYQPHSGARRKVRGYPMSLAIIVRERWVSVCHFKAICINVVKTFLDESGGPTHRLTDTSIVHNGSQPVKAYTLNIYSKYNGVAVSEEQNIEFVHPYIPNSPNRRLLVAWAFLFDKVHLTRKAQDSMWESLHTYYKNC